MKNIPFLNALSECDAAISPTKWQRSRFPKWAQDKIQVIHEGLDLRELKAVKPRPLGIPSQGLKLKKGMPIITYSSRYLEPVRGFHYFMEALPAILAARPDAHAIIMGQDAGIFNIGYGRENPAGMSWRQTMEKKLGNRVDWSRVHFLGMLDRRLYLAMLKLSACHVYLTTPFILSWSFLEAAALGLPIVASNTAPVREFDNLQGIDLVGFDDVDGLAARVLLHLENPEQNFYDDNIAMLQNLDIKKTIPMIKEILLSGARATDASGGALEEIVLLDED